MQEGLVVRSTGSWYRVRTDDGGYVDCRLRGRYRLQGSKQTSPVAVGDKVVYEMQADGTGLIGDVQERRNYIVRRATKLSKQTHVIAANIDLLCVVASTVSPRTSTGFIDRMLVTAEAYHIPACVIYNKSDLLEDVESILLQQNHAELYTKAGYRVLEVSAKSGAGLDELKSMIEGRVVLFSGHSGVGKSALLNALYPGLNLRVGEVSEWNNKGRHTTTFAEIFELRNTNPCCAEDTKQADVANPTFLIDTPGIKEFGLVGLSPQELSHLYPEMRAVLHYCRFANCTHRHEPQCAVVEAVASGAIAEERYRNYIAIMESLDQ